MSIYLVIVWFISIPLILIFAVSFMQQQRKKAILRRLMGYSFDKVNVHYNQQRTGIGTISVGGLSVKAVMYISERILIVTPREKGYFNGLFNLNLPVIFIKEESDGILLGGLKGMTPIQISLSDWNALLIHYKDSLMSYNIQISLLDKSDSNKLEILKTWERNQNM